MNSGENMNRGAHGRLRSRRIDQRGLGQHEPEADRISRLPIDILLKIFDLLPMESWLTMSTVSKQFKPLRTHVPDLDFDQEEMEDKIMRNNICPVYGEYHPGHLPIVCHPYCAEVTRTKFIRLVDRIIRSHSGSKINNFSLYISYYERNWDIPMVNSWVNFALTKNIEEVELHFDQSFVLEYVTRNGLRVSKIDTVNLYTLPSQPSPPKILTTLTLHGCQFDASCFGTFESLRCLNLIKVDLLDNRIEHWLSIFPMLSELYMMRCVLEETFFVTDKVIKIESLFLSNCMTSRWMMFPILMTVPNLTTFQFYGTYLKGSSLRGADKLTDVHINIEYRIADRLQGSFLYLILQDLRSCQHLELNSWCIQVLSSTQSRSWKYLPQLQNITELTLGVFMIREELPGICCLLRSCPLLQTLTMERQRQFAGARITWEGFVRNSQNMPFDCLQNSLKTISILGFTGQDMEWHILRFLLKNAVVLETLHIRVNGTLRIAETVKNFVKASPRACVIINDELVS